MNTTSNTRAFIEAEQYSDFILTISHDGMLPEAFYRDVADFGSGEVLKIKTIGDVTLQEMSEDEPFVYNPIETGNVTLQITEFPGDAWYVTDKLRQDGAQIESLMMARSTESTRAYHEYKETKALATLNAGQTAGDLNEINGFAHRYVATGANNTLNIDDLNRMKLAFDKAQMPYAGRVAIVDPIVAATLNDKFQGTYNVDSNPTMQSILTDGFAVDHSFIMDVFGWNIMTSNRLPAVASETIDGTTVTNGVANIFMCVQDDNVKALMYADRQPLSVEGDRNKDLKRDEFVSSARYGFGVQRVDSLGVILTSATAYK